MNKYDKTIHEIRRFNRFYTVHMGFWDSGYLDTKYSIAESRILFEIKSHKMCIQSEIAKALHIDKSYLSRIIKRFDKDGLIKKKPCDTDKRASHIILTPKGHAETERLIALTNQQIQSEISKLNSRECDKLCNALNQVIAILGKENASDEDYSI